MDYGGFSISEGDKSEHADFIAAGYTVLEAAFSIFDGNESEHTDFTTADPTRASMLTLLPRTLQSWKHLRR